MSEYDARTLRSRRLPEAEPETAPAEESDELDITGGLRPTEAVRVAAPGVGQYQTETATALTEPQPLDPRDTEHTAMPSNEPTEAAPQAGLASLPADIVRCQQCGSIQGMFYHDRINGTVRHVGCSVVRLGQSRQYEVKVSDARKELPTDLR